MKLDSFKMVYGVATLLLTLFSHAAFSITYLHNSFTVDEGLPSNEIYAVLQDSKGFIWFATDNGISRYDGYTFVNFSTENGLTDLDVLDLMEDSQGRIWFYTNNGKACFYNGEIYNAEKDSLLANLNFSKFPINGILEDHDQNIWIGQVQSHIHCYPFSNSTACDNLPDLRNFDQKNLRFEGFWQDTGTNLWMISSNGYFRISDSLFIASNFQSIYDSRISRSPNDNGVLYSVLEGIAIFNGEEERLFLPKKELPEDRIIFLDWNGPSQLLIGTTNGAYVYLLEHEKVEKRHYFLAGEIISHIVQDHEGGFWITSIEHGAFYIPSLQYHSITQKTDGLSSSNVLSIYPRKNSLLIGYDVPKLDTWNDNEIMQSTIPETKVSLSHDIQFHRYDDSHLLLQRNSEVLLWNNGITGVIEKYTKCVCAYNNGDLLLGNNNKVYHLPEYFTNGTHSGMDAEKHLIDSLYGALSCYNLGGDTFIIGTNKGLKYLIDDQFIAHDQHYELFQLPVINIGGFFDDLIWVATKSQGIYGFNHDTLIQLSTENGLTSNRSTKLYIDNNALWVVTNKGLSKIKRTAKYCYKVSSIDITDGLASNQVNDLFTDSTYLWVATSKGITRMPLNSSADNESTIPFFIESFTVGIQNLAFQQPLRLRHSDNDISVTYKAIAFKQHSDLTYFYRISQDDTTWKATQSTSLNFPALANGAYTLEIYAALSNGSARSETRKIEFRVLQPFWLQSWFFGLIGSLLILLTLAVLWIIRFAKEHRSMNSALQTLKEKLQREAKGTLLFRIDGKRVPIKLKDILWIKAAVDYAEIITSEKKYLVHSSLKSIENQLPEDKFIRTHRSFIVNIDKIDGIISKKVITVNGIEIPVGKTYNSTVPMLRGRIHSVSLR